MEEMQSGKQKYEEMKSQKQKERSGSTQPSKGTQRRVRTAVRFVIVAVIVGALGYMFFGAVKRELPKGEDYSVLYESQGEEHIEAGAEHPSYSSNPPSSGWHYDAPVSVGFYSDAIPDEQIIHNLEHGDIWIAYHPRISGEAVTALRQFENDGKVIITPREENDFDISLVAWERVDSFDIEGTASYEERIGNFIKRYRNRGPERVN